MNSCLIFEEAGSIEYFDTIENMTERISIKARLRPAHAYAPIWKGMKTEGSLLSSRRVVQRSGMKLSG